MRISELFHRNRLAAVLFLVGALGLAAGCGDAPSVAPAGTPADTKAKEESERAAREKAYGGKSIPPDTKKAAASAPK